MLSFHYFPMLPFIFFFLILNTKNKELDTPKIWGLCHVWFWSWCMEIDWINQTSSHCYLIGFTISWGLQVSRAHRLCEQKLYYCSSAAAHWECLTDQIVIMCHEIKPWCYLTTEFQFLPPPLFFFSLTKSLPRDSLPCWVAPTCSKLHSCLQKSFWYH